MKNNQYKEWTYCHLAMDLSRGNFAWDFFGRMSATHEGGYAPMKSPDEYARDYLSTFHADALYDLEIEMSNNSQKGLAITA
jgi:hypothetical protein